MPIVVDLHNDNSERVRYNEPEFPVHTSRALLSYYPNFAAPSHWHDDLEFIIIFSGTMDYNVNGEVFTLKCGEGIFVNSRQIHFGFSKGLTECEFLCVLLHPIMLCANSYMERNFVYPVISNHDLPYILLSPDVAWKRDIIGSLTDIYDVCGQKSNSYMMTVESLFYKIWALIFDNSPSPEKNGQATSSHLSCLKDMIGYIQKNHAEKISLAEIAASGRVCKSSCCGIFKEYLHQTPVGYLTEYRLNKSVELLQRNELTVTEISYAVGFSGASYYTEIFRKYFGCVPTEYRKRLQKRE